MRSKISDFTKRVFDLIVITPVTLFLFIPIAIITGFVFLTLGKTVFFRQKRPGLHGKPFFLYKFRIMSDARDGQGNLLPDEQRLTSLGRFLRSTSLDELPELINVLKGEMSLVGPRPLLTQYLERYTPEQARRHEVKPGLTG